MTLTFDLCYDRNWNILQQVHDLCAPSKNLCMVVTPTFWGLKRKLQLRWITQWIGSKRAITICTTVKTWLFQGSQTLSQCDLKWQRPMRALVLFTLQKKLCTNMRRMQLLSYAREPGCSGRSASCVSSGSTFVVTGSANLSSILFPCAKRGAQRVTVKGKFWKSFNFQHHCYVHHWEND